MLPPATPVTTPVPLTDATRLLAVDQVPPGMASVNVVSAPWHSDDAPLMLPALGSGFMVTEVPVAAVPQLVTTV